MEALTRLDTHVVLWLYTGEVEKLSASARAALDAGPCAISPVVQLELTYLHEIGRLRVGGADIVADLHERIGLVTSDRSLPSIVAAAGPLSWTRDPFDRLIVGDALAAAATLLTKDDVIRANCELARW